MLHSFFSKPRMEIDDDVFEAAKLALQDRMFDMLERDAIRQIRFATIDNTPSYLR